MPESVGRRWREGSLRISLPDGRSARVRRVIDPRARHLRLQLALDGPRLTVPPGADPALVRAFLDRHLGWLAGELEALDRQRARRPRLELDEPGWLPLRGRELALAWREAAGLRIAQEGGTLVICRPVRASLEAVRQALRAFLVAAARADVGRWLPAHLDGLPRPLLGWRIQPLASLWGSLSARGRMSLDLALVLGPPAAFEYVLVHELCHLAQPNHSPAFWREVEQRFPGWREQRRWLGQHGQELKRQLRWLLAGPG